MTRLLHQIYLYYHNHSTEIVGFLTGGTAGTVTYIQWQDKLITVAFAFATGFLGAAGATLWKYIAKKLAKK